MTIQEEQKSPSDVDLVAFLDGELGDIERSKVISALLTRPDTLARLSELDRAGQSWTEFFDGLAKEAPHRRLEAQLNAALRIPIRSRWWQYGRPMRAMGIAAAMAMLLATGALVDRAVLHYGAVRSGEVELAGEFDWREAVANYFALYTNDTLSGPPVEIGAQAFYRLQEAIGLPLSPERVELPDVNLVRTVLYSYEGRPLAQIAYLDPSSGPMAFCIVTGIEGEQPFMTERRAGMNIIFWSKNGNGFLLIGHASTGRLADFATLLSEQI